MQQLYEGLANVALGLLELAVLVGIVALIRRRLPDLRSVGLALAVLFVAHFAIFLGLIPKTPGSWNWLGKVLSIGVTLAAIAIIPSLSWRETGFTWNQNRALGPAIVAMLVTWAFAWGLNIALAGPHFKIPNLETFFYQATMPGLNEEPLYRGVALVLLDRAFANERAEFLGAPIGWGAIITSVWFGLIHGNGIGNGHFQIDPVTIVAVAIIGFGLAWIRMRTGSLAMCVVAHNVQNVVQHFI